MKSEYAKAGVDVQAGNETVSRIKAMVESTYDENVLGTLGAYGGCYALPQARDMREPVLVSGADGVGTKLKLAMVLDKHDTIGIDCVAMCVNDILCQGAKPLFFLDYIAVGKLVPERAASIVNGVAEGCRQAGCALIGGETAEMPGFYAPDEYDLAGFAVGIADRHRLIGTGAVAQGDVLIGLASNGVHSNGFSLIRKIFPMEREALKRSVPALGMPLGEALLTPTRIYVKPVLAVGEEFSFHALAHITGGGFIDNIPRIMPDGLCAHIELDKCHTPPLFDVIEHQGGLDRMEMYNVFNMGIGMVAVVSAADAQKALGAFRDVGETAYIIGKVEAGDEKVKLS